MIRFGGYLGESLGLRGTLLVGGVVGLLGVLVVWLSPVRHAHAGGDGATS